MQVNLIDNNSQKDQAMQDLSLAFKQ